MSFKAVRVEKTDAGQRVGFAEVEDGDLMDGDVTVRVTHSTINYKDGLALSGKSRDPPQIPDVARHRFRRNRRELRPSGFQSRRRGRRRRLRPRRDPLRRPRRKARVKGDWLVKLPAPFSRAEAMAIGTAGYTAALAVDALGAAGLSPDMGPAVVTGAAGGVGSVAIALLAKAGYSVSASTGRAAEADYLKRLGAAEIIDRATLSGAGQAAGEGALDRRGRQRRLAYARQPAVADALWRRHRRLRARRRHGPAGLRGAVHPARRQAARNRQRAIARCRDASPPGRGSPATSTAGCSRA